MALSLLVSSVISQIINSWPNKKLLGYSYIEQLRDILPSILLAVFMGIIIFLIGLIKMPIIVSLVVQVVIGGVIYIAGAKILKIDTFEYIMEIVKGILNKKKIII